MGAFTVGNAHRESIADLYDKMRARSHFRLINLEGPRRLHEVMKAARPDRDLPETYTSICELCVRSTQGVPTEEVENIVGDYMLKRLLDGLMPAGAAAETDP